MKEKVTQEDVPIGEISDLRLHRLRDSARLRLSDDLNKDLASLVGAYQYQRNANRIEKEGAAHALESIRARIPAAAHLGLNDAVIVACQNIDELRLDIKHAAADLEFAHEVLGNREIELSSMRPLLIEQTRKAEYWEIESGRRQDRINLDAERLPLLEKELERARLWLVTTWLIALIIQTFQLLYIWMMHHG